MGFAKKHDLGIRVYKDRGKAYMLAIREPRDQWGILAELMINNDPEHPVLIHSWLWHWDLIRHKRADWDDLPEVWQRALARDLNGLDPSRIPGLHRHKVDNPYSEDEVNAAWQVYNY